LYSSSATPSLTNLDIFVSECPMFHAIVFALYFKASKIQI
jgi:hypothetical protein